MVHDDDSLDKILAHYTQLGDVTSIARIDAGLINKTYLVHSSHAPFVLQEVSPIFDVTVNHDSLAVSSHLAKAHIKTPTILPTDDGKLYCQHQGRVFRALSYINGRTFHKITVDKMATEAGRVVGEFHAALMDFDYTYQSRRAHGGNYAFHTQNLENTLKNGEGHDYFARVKPLGLLFLAELAKVTAGLITTPRHAHGDPKISNILFTDDLRGICLIDFDTLGLTGWSLELADAMRSWCNKNAEDVLDAQVDLGIAELALSGYAQAMAKKMTPGEIDQFVTHTQAISLCLAMRYLSDVLTENYFAFDRKRFARAADHNLLRAQAMFHLFGEFQKCAHELKPMAQDLLL